MRSAIRCDSLWLAAEMSGCFSGWGREGLEKAVGPVQDKELQDALKAVAKVRVSALGHMQSFTLLLSEKLRSHMSCVAVMHPHDAHALCKVWGHVLLVGAFLPRTHVPVSLRALQHSWSDNCTNPPDRMCLAGMSH